MRIISGMYGGRKLKTLDGKDTRPTADRVRESLFSIILPRITDAMVLDLFAGCGALGLEAVSRGARFAVLNDYSPRAAAVIQDNVEALGAEDLTGVMCQDAAIALDQLRRGGMAFDLIFLDPPYDSGLYTPAIFDIRELGLLAEGGMIICEHKKGHKFEIPYDFRIYDRRDYGRTQLSFLIMEVVR